MPNTYQTADGRSIQYEPRKLGLRGMRSLLECVESISAIKSSNQKSLMFEAIEKGVKICIPDYDPEANDVDMDSAMTIMSDTLNFNSVKADERKKSE